jgi:hypothetical protein
MDPVKVRKVNMSDFLESMKRIKKSIASDNLGKLATYTVKKGWRFSHPQPAGMSLSKISLAGNNLIIPAQGEFGSYIPSGDGILIIFFYSVGLENSTVY